MNWILYKYWWRFDIPEEEIVVGEWIFILTMESNLEGKPESNHHDKQDHSICEDILDDGVENDPKVSRSEGKSSKQDDEL